MNELRDAISILPEHVQAECVTAEDCAAQLSDYALHLEGKIESKDARIASLEARVKELEWGLRDARGFANWVECLGRTDCEIYKSELKHSADLSLERIAKLIGYEDE